MTTTAELITQVRQLATDYPNARYHKAAGSSYCEYADGTVTNGPDHEGCIMGQAARLLEIDLSNWGRVEIHQLLDDEGWDMHDYNAIDWLTQVQQIQDGGSTWSDAIVIADKKPSGP